MFYIIAGGISLEGDFEGWLKKGWFLQVCNRGMYDKRICYSFQVVFGSFEIIKQSVEVLNFEPNKSFIHRYIITQY